MVNKKTSLRKWIIKIGEKSVGKSLLYGMYDPLIPDELKQAVPFIVKHEAVKNRTVIIMEEKPY